ncbi:hypothetical protein PSHT_04891 [Puccinia striiformis]|uniref:Uncharacterized protein n=1 Tax=Puccinia striiformis TaxID=27350 RepID=A0A2S4WBU1_9BASI|nr:hypothetical protein PSHT_04891 [Puccinia striiformis]
MCCYFKSSIRSGRWHTSTRRRQSTRPSGETGPTENFSFRRKLSWSNQDFELTRVSDNHPVLRAETHLSSQFSGIFRLDILVPGQPKLEVKVHKGAVWCGFRQTYELSNGVQLLVDPRGLLTDRWLIKRSGSLTRSYTWKRHAQGTGGPLLSEDGRTVAQFKTKTWGSESWASLYHETTPGFSEHEIITNGEVPLEVLTALFISAIVRKDACNW